MTIPKTVDDWKVVKSTKDDGCVVVEMNHPEFGYVVSMSEPGTDPQITFNATLMAAYEEQYRMTKSQDVETKIADLRSTIVAGKRERSLAAAEKLAAASAKEGKS